MGQETSTEQTCLWDCWCFLFLVKLAIEHTHRKPHVCHIWGQGEGFSEFLHDFRAFSRPPFLMGWALWWETRAGTLGLRCSSEERGPSCRKAHLLHMVKLRPWEWVVPQSELLLILLKRPCSVKGQPGLCCTGFLSKMTCFKTLGNRRRQKGERVKWLRVSQEVWRLLLAQGLVSLEDI